VDVVVCGVCGGSGSGKTTLTKRVVELLGGADVSVLAFDAYYRDLSNLEPAERARRNFDHPDSLDHELFISHLDSLRGGEDVQVPVYDFATHTRTGQFQTMPASPLLLVEGILLLAFAEIRRRLDHTVFLDARSETRLQRRIRRDVAERGRLPANVRRQFAATVAPMHDAFVYPNRCRADRIVANDEADLSVIDDLAAEVAALRLQIADSR